MHNDNTLVPDIENSNENKSNLKEEEKYFPKTGTIAYIGQYKKIKDKK